MVEIKTAAEIQAMRAAGQVVAQVLDFGVMKISAAPCGLVSLTAV